MGGLVESFAGEGVLRGAGGGRAYFEQDGVAACTVSSSAALSAGVTARARQVQGMPVTCSAQKAEAARDTSSASASACCSAAAARTSARSALLAGGSKLVKVIGAYGQMCFAVLLSDPRSRVRSGVAGSS